MALFKSWAQTVDPCEDLYAAENAYPQVSETPLIDKQYEQAQRFNRNRPHYVAVTTCDKCGNYERHSTRYKVHDYTNSKGEVFTDEWLARECGGCGYKWNQSIVSA